MVEFIPDPLARFAPFLPYPEVEGEVVEVHFAPGVKDQGRLGEGTFTSWLAEKFGEKDSKIHVPWPLEKAVREFFLEKPPTKVLRFANLEVAVKVGARTLESRKLIEEDPLKVLEKDILTFLWRVCGKFPTRRVVRSLSSFKAILNDLPYSVALENARVEYNFLGLPPRKVPREYLHSRTNLFPEIVSRLVSFPTGAPPPPFPRPPSAPKPPKPFFP